MVVEYPYVVSSSVTSEAFQSRNIDYPTAFSFIMLESGDIESFIFAFKLPA